MNAIRVRPRIVGWATYTGRMNNDEMDLSHATDGRELSPGPDAPGLESKTPSSRRHTGWLVAALVLAVIGLAYALFDWNLFKGYAERRVSAATGREFHIDGNLGVRLSMHPLVTMDGLRLGNIKRATPAVPRRALAFVERADDPPRGPPDEAVGAARALSRRQRQLDVPEFGIESGDPAVHRRPW